jgi:hypothetical protein
LFITFVISLVLSNNQWRPTKLQKRRGYKFATVLLAGIVVFLAVDIGFFLYDPDRLDFTLPFSTLNVIRGNIQVQTKDSLVWEKAEDGMTLEPGSRVRTAPDSYAAIDFARGTTSKLEPGTDIIIAKLENNEDKQLDTIMLKQQSGKTWNQVAKREEDSYNFQIQTPAADIVVHGTSFATEVDESGKTTVQTAEGRVSVSAQGQEVQVPAGQQTTVESGEPPAAPAPVPPATNELVLTIGKPAMGIIEDPSGSSTGYLGDGAPVNQITGSQLSTPEDIFQTVRIPEPATGDYTIKLHGAADGITSWRIEGFAEGENTFSYAESCNITTANDYVLKLHLDVLNGLLGKATVVKAATPESQPGPTATTAKAVTEEKEMPVVSSKEAAPAQKESWLHIGDRYIANIWITVSIIVLVLGGILAVVWRRI